MFGLLGVTSNEVGAGMLTVTLTVVEFELPAKSISVTVIELDTEDN